MICAKCLQGELVPLTSEFEADYQCPFCGAFYFDIDPEFPSSEEDYILWQ